MVGHLFGYEAALAIDAQARPLREARAAIEASASVPVPTTVPARPAAARPRSVASRAVPRTACATGSYNGHLEAAPRCGWSRCCATPPGVLPLEGYELEYGQDRARRARWSATSLDALTAGIDELTRPVDAIKHQAKTVTVGISRSEDALLGCRSSRPRWRPAPPRDTPGLPGPAHARRPGRSRWPRCRVTPATASSGRPAADATIAVVDQGGSRADLPRPGPSADPRAARHQAPGRRGTGGHRGARAPATAAP